MTTPSATRAGVAGTSIGEAVCVDGSSFELRGSLVVVRDFLAEDEDAFVEWAGHQEMYEYMAWRLDSAAAAVAYFHGLFTHPERTASERRHWYLAVVNLEGAFCGFAGFDVRQDGCGQFGWYLAPRFWGRGYATEISSLFLEFGFENLGLPAVLATCDPANLASRRVLEKSGLSFVDEETVNTWQGERQRLRFIITAAEWHRSRQDEWDCSAERAVPRWSWPVAWVFSRNRGRRSKTWMYASAMTSSACASRTNGSAFAIWACGPSRARPGTLAARHRG